MYLKIIEARFSRIKSWELQAKLWPIWIWKADSQFTLSAFSRYHQMGKRSDMRLPQGKDVCKKKTRVAGNWLREGPGFCCGNTNKHATFHTFSGCFWGVSGVFWKGYSEEIQLLSLPLQGGNQFCRRSRPTCDLVWVRLAFQFTLFHQPQCFLSGIPRLEKSWHFSLERKCAWGTF